MDKQENSINSQEKMLAKLGISTLNTMQQEAFEAIEANPDVIILSGTGTGKTVAFLLPILSKLNSDLQEIQAMIIVPSRELALQIEQVARQLGAGFKINAIYGGRSGSKDREELKHKPALLIGTPGRVADRIRRESFSTEHIQTLVLDEFDKSLEIGFEEEMTEIISALSHVKRRVLTSATQGVDIPDFVGLVKPKYINHLKEARSDLKIVDIPSSDKGRLDTISSVLCHLGDQRGIVFCNFKDSISEVSEALERKGISHECFYGGLEQKDRERALIKFRNGTTNVLLATDLAARGIDVPELNFIIHFELPHKKEEFVHRNGRTARMNSSGSAYLIGNKNKRYPDFIHADSELVIKLGRKPTAPNWVTLFVSGGRKDKISKGDLAGAFIKQGGITSDQLGVIELKSDCAFVAVQFKCAGQVIQQVNNTKLKKKKVRVTKI